MNTEERELDVNFMSFNEQQLGWKRPANRVKLLSTFKKAFYSKESKKIRDVYSGSEFFPFRIPDLHQRT